MTTIAKPPMSSPAAAAHSLAALQERVKKGATVDAAFVKAALHDLADVDLAVAKASGRRARP